MNVSTKQQRIAKSAKEHPQRSFVSLHHHIDDEWLHEAHRRTRKNGAVGVDEQTAEQYAADLDANLDSLRERAKSGRYQAPPVRRTWIDKPGKREKRPLGIPTYEDKVLQRAVVMVLEPLYEQDFLDCSHGFRPRRSAHGALQALWEAIMSMGGCWLLDVDIRKYFDTIDHGQLRAILDRRVRDGVIRRLIGKWLKAGVMEEGRHWYPESGAPQGGVVSPMLSNIYLHDVLDVWFERMIKPRLKGRAFLIRYADDFVMGFELREDAERVLAVLPKRFGKFGLAIHPDKTRLVRFTRPRRTRDGAPPDKPETFDLLGFTHYWGRSRRGRWIVKRKTARDRLNRGLKLTAEWCRKNRHLPLREQQRKLSQTLIGHYAYFGITGNSPRLERFRRAVTRLWRKWLRRRTRKRSALTWERFNRLLATYPLPPARVYHSVYAVKP
jgi:group II intron reverse transcriptase/maturase